MGMRTRDRWYLEVARAEHACAWGILAVKICYYRDLGTAGHESAVPVVRHWMVLGWDEVEVEALMEQHRPRTSP